MAPEFVSIVIPTFNRRYCIGRTLDSVRAQTHERWEAIIVDDGSTDDTVSLIRDAYGHDPRFRYVRQENGGVSRARNTGLAVAHGDFVALLDSDDVWEPWKLELQLLCLRNFPALGMVWTDLKAIGPDGSVLDERHLRTMYGAYRFHRNETLFEESIPLRTFADGSVAPAAENMFRMGDIYPAMIAGNLVHTSTVLVRRERIKQVGGFDESLHLSGEDYDFHLRTCQFGPVGLIDMPAIWYQKGRPDQLTNHMAAIAANFVLTVERAVKRDAVSKRFDPALVDTVLAEGHGWVAEEMAKKPDRRAVWHHVLQSMRRRPWQPRLWALAALALIPVSLRASLVAGYRRLRRTSAH